MITNRVKRHPVSVYLPPNGMADRWKQLADKAGLSLSQYIQNIVEDHIKKFEEPINPNDLGGQIDRIKEMRNHIKKQQSDIKKRHSRIEEWLRHNEDMIQIIKKESKDPSFREIEKYKFRIITLLKERKVVKEQELLDLLRVDHSDTESVKIVDQQLDNLLVFNLIKRSNGKIIWIK